MRDPVSERLAQRRWMMIQMLRAIGFALILIGILLTQGALSFLNTGNEILGYLLIVVGLFDGFFVPLILARIWRTPRR